MVLNLSSTILKEYYNTTTNTSVSSQVLNENLSTNSSGLPKEFLEMTNRSRIEIVIYLVLLSIGSIGNLSVFYSLFRQVGKLKSRIIMLLLNLNIADLLVMFFLIPMEITWRITIEWSSSELMCKSCQFFRAFGLYLSSYSVVCISLERFMTVLYPMRMAMATRRVKIIIVISWFIAALSASPQSLVFSVQSHPDYPSFKQCVSFGYFSNQTKEIIYNLFSLSALFFIPLFVIVFSYGSIRWKINSKANRGPEMCEYQLGQFHHEIVIYDQSKEEMLRITLIIIIVCVICFTPYAVINLWYMFDKEGAQNLNKNIQDFLFIMVVSNSCLNPFVYGDYARQINGPIYSFRWKNIFTTTDSNQQSTMISI